MNVLELFSDELEKLVAKVAPGVVALEHRRGHGTGVIVAKDGYVLTNAHVVRDARKVRVRLCDGERLEGELVGADPPTDLAVLRVDGPALSPLPLADMSQVRVGQVVLALGHPYGFERSVSLGVVSALERQLPSRDGLLDDLIQTDAAINPGNSGGPLVNVRGEIVGINTAMLPFAQGIGFAIPASTAAWVTAVLVQRGAIHRRYLGIAARTEPLPPSVARALGQARGVRVVDVGERSPAQLAGLRPDDVLLSINGSVVKSIDDLQRLMALDADPELRVAYWRKGDRREAMVRPEKRRAA